MAEYNDYRDVLRDLSETFGKDRIWISAKELAESEGVCVRTIKSRYQIPTGVNGISKTILAKRMCELAK